MNKPLQQFLAIFEQSQITEEISFVLKTKQIHTIYTYNESVYSACEKIMTPHGVKVESLYRFTEKDSLYGQFGSQEVLQYDANTLFVSLLYQNYSYLFSITLPFEKSDSSYIRLSEITFENAKIHQEDCDFSENAHFYLKPVIKELAGHLTVFIQSFYRIAKSNIVAVYN